MELYFQLLIYINIWCVASKGLTILNTEMLHKNQIIQMFVNLHYLFYSFKMVLHDITSATSDTVHFLQSWHSAT